MQFIVLKKQLRFNYKKRYYCSEKKEANVIINTTRKTFKEIKKKEITKEQFIKLAKMIEKYHKEGYDKKIENALAKHDKNPDVY